MLRPPMAGLGWKNRSRVCAKRWNTLYAVFLRHILPALQTCGLLIRAGKTSYTTVTLGEIKPGIICNK
jgi:hypothetical protein